MEISRSGRCLNKSGNRTSEIRRTRPSRKLPLFLTETSAKGRTTETKNKPFSIVFCFRVRRMFDNKLQSRPDSAVPSCYFYTWSLVHTSTFPAASFSVRIFICSCTWENLPEFYTEKKCHMQMFVRCAQPVTENLPHTQTLAVAFPVLSSTVHSHLWCIGKRVFKIAFAAFIHEQIPLSQKTCYRKFARVDKV